MEERELTPGEAFAEQMKKARRSAGVTQADLSARLERLGFHLSRAAILEIEKKSRRISLDEALAISAALDVAPVNMIVPFEDDRVLDDEAADLGYGVFEPVSKLKIGSALVMIPSEARSWIRGTAIHLSASVEGWNQYYCVQVSPGERHQLRKVADYVLAHHKKLGRWKLPKCEPIPTEEPPEMAVPGFTTPENRRGFPAPIWTWLMFHQKED